MANTKQLLGEEDVLFGQGQVEQTYKDELITITKINSDSIPFQGEPGDGDYKSTKDIIDELLLGSSEAIVEW